MHELIQNCRLEIPTLARLQTETWDRSNRHEVEYLASVSHELRTPLAEIQNAVRVLSLQLESWRCGCKQEVIRWSLESETPVLASHQGPFRTFSSCSDRRMTPRSTPNQDWGGWARIGTRSS